MGEEPSDQDNALLARLKALKQSDVGFDHPFIASFGTRDTPEDLVARFQKLHGRNAAGEYDNTVAEAVPDDDVGSPSPTIEELLAELSSEDQYSISDTDLKQGDQLLAEAKDALTEDLQRKEPDLKTATKEKYEGLIRSATSPEQALDEYTEAEASLQRILDEAELEKQQEPAPADASTRYQATPRTRSHL